jgi:GNAT superfamily N-acetyltransferase/heme-degrading monooxygenase HmoA
MADGDPQGASVAFDPAREEDLDALLALMARYYGEDGYPFDAAAARRAARELLRDPALGCVWVMRDGAEIVGYAVLALGWSLEYRGRDAFLDELYVLPGHRGRGLGARVLALVQETARALGVNALHLEVERDKPAAAARYRGAGFVDHDRCLMTKWLRPAGAAASEAAIPAAPADAPYVYAWEYRVRPEATTEFERVYGPAGDWVALFRRAPGYLETRLLRDLSAPGRYVTIDRWRCAADFRAFRARFAAEFEALDRRCELLTLDERPLGRFAPAAM